MVQVHGKAWTLVGQLYNVACMRATILILSKYVKFSSRSPYDAEVPICRKSTQSTVSEKETAIFASLLAIVLDTLGCTMVSR